MKQKLVCCVLVVLALSMAAWAITGNIENRRLRERVEALEAQVASSVPEIKYSPDEPAAEFNGGIVTVAEASAEYAMLRPYYEMLGMPEEEYAEYAKLDVLDMLIEQKIIENKARELGVYELDNASRAELEDRVRAEYEEMIAYYMPFRFDASRTDDQIRQETIEYLNENGSSYESMLAQAEADAWRDRLFEAVTADLHVDDAQLRSFYDEQLSIAELAYSANYAEYEMDCEAGRAVLWHPEGVRRVQMLVIPFTEEQAADYADIQALLASGDASRLEDLDALYLSLSAEAEKALARAEAGEDFVELMSTYGGGKPDGECFSAKSEIFGDEIRDAAMELESIGDLSGILRCDGGLCILRYASDVTPGPVSFENIADDLRANYSEELRLSRYNTAVMQWISEADIKYYPEKF